MNNKIKIKCMGETTHTERVEPTGEQPMYCRKCGARTEVKRTPENPYDS